MPLGREISDNEDWLAYLRDVIAHPGAHPELHGGQPFPASLSTIERELEGTHHAVRFADAALSLVEAGSADEAEAVRGLAVHTAPDAAARLRAVVGRRELPVGLRLRVANALLLAVPDDPIGIAAIRSALDDPAHRAPALLAAARHFRAWPGTLLALAPPDEALLLGLWKATPVARRQAFVAAVDAAGKLHLDALIAGARRLGRVSREQASPLMMMLSPYLEDPTTGEVLVETMLEQLRAHHQDPERRDARQAELAERMLSRRELWPKPPKDPDDDGSSSG